MSYEMIVQLVDNGTITRYTIIRGPSTGQLWTVARKTPGVAHLLGDCHHCNAKVSDGVTRCPECHTVFGAWLDRNAMGLPEIRPLPGEPGSIETTPFDPSSQSGFRPLSSDGLSAFLHTESSDPTEAPAALDDDEKDADADDVVGEDEGVSSIFDNSLRAELLAAKRQSSRLLIVASLAVLAAVATLAMVWLGGEDNSIIEESSLAPTTTEEAVLDPVDPVEPVQGDVLAPTAPVPAVVVEQPVPQTTEEDLVAHLARAADGSLSIEKRSQHLERAEELISELTNSSPDTGTSTRLEEYGEELARLRERLVFDGGSE
jgi:hypothetical protein